MFFNILHKEGDARVVLIKRYRGRWCAPDFVQTRLRLAPVIWHQIRMVACKNLLWLGRRVPSRVHLPNIRLHYNGWLTARRYQARVDSKCVFCNDNASEDSIAHILKCEFVQSPFPNRFSKRFSISSSVETFLLIWVGRETQNRVRFDDFCVVLRA